MSFLFRRKHSHQATEPSDAPATTTAAPTTPAKPELPPPTSDIITTVPASYVPKPRTYTDEQAAQITALKTYAHTLLLPPTDPYYPWEKRFLDDDTTHERFMRAAKWKPADAQKRIKATIEWRREYRPELIRPDEVEPAAAMGKIAMNGFDLDGRPIIYLRPGRPGTPDHDMQTKYLIYLLERAIDLMPEGQEQTTIVVDFKGGAAANRTPVSVSLNVLHILQNHYVERMGRGLVVNMPWFVNAFFSAISPFMDPITRDKIRFGPTLTDLIDPTQLESEYPNGQNNYKFEIEPFWTQLNGACHIAEDGTRTGPDGNPWIPPSGKGIKWAVEHFVPGQAGQAGDEATNLTVTQPNKAASVATSTTASVVEPLKVVEDSPNALGLQMAAA